MKKALSGLLALSMLLALTSCGVKGPLYFPQEQQQQTKTQQ